MKAIMCGVAMFLLSLPVRAQHTSAHHQVDRHKQVSCIAKTIYFEARGESTSGKKAVAMTVFNRADSDKFPDTPCAVIHQRQGRRCQFDWVCHGRSVPADSDNYQAIVALAARLFDAWKDGALVDITHGSLYFSKHPSSHALKIDGQFFRREMARR